MLERIYWHTPHRIIIAEYKDTITLPIFIETAQRVSDEITAEGKPPYVHHIVDVTARAEIDRSMFNLKTMKEAQTLTEHPLLGWTIVADANPNPVMKFIGTTIMQLTQNRFRIVDTLDNAIAFLESVDQTL